MSKLTNGHEHKQWVAGIFDRASASYDRVGPRSFTHFGRGLVAFSEIAAGSRILDIACGRGAVLIPASEKTGERGEVIGIDISKNMVSYLESDLKRLGISNANVLVMDAEDLRFDDRSFDSVLCGFALFFLPNLEAALAGCLRVLRPGGAFICSTFAGMDTPYGDSVFEVGKSYRGKLATAPIAETKSLFREEELVEELAAARFKEIEHQLDTYQVFFRDEMEWWQMLWSIYHRGFLERLDADLLAAYKQEVMEIVRDCTTDRGIPITYTARYTRAKKPA